MDKSLDDLILMSTQVGRDPELVQGGGGNTSVKTPDGKMYVKASGTALGDMAEGKGYRQVDVARCVAILDEEGLASMPVLEREALATQRLLECCVDDLPGRPSVEASLHAFLGRCVVHTHASVVNGLLCAKDSRSVVEDLFSELDPPCLYIEWTDYGHPLATRTREAVAEYKGKHGHLPKVVLLGNHGVFVSTESPGEALELTAQVFEIVRRAWWERMRGVEERRAPEFPLEVQAEMIADTCAGLRATYADIYKGRVLVRFSAGNAVKTFLSHPRAAELAATPALWPDQVVYCRGGPLWVAAPEEGGLLRSRVEEAVRARADDSHTPTCLVADGLGLFAVGTTPKLLDSALATMEAVLRALVVSSCFGGARGLPESSVQMMRDSEVEQYRHRLLAGGGDGNGIARRVAVISGAGSGLGRGISIGLARKGAHVVLADIDLDSARETARRIADEGSSGSGWPVKADVTSEESVRNLFAYTITQLGGVDILVNAAGIAPPHALIDFPLTDWRKALEVNLTGYFLMAREAARVMKRQGSGGNIINLSSKSGLDPSKNNSAYNATKAGEIHLARGWALELAEYGIRANSVCPGNVFRESKIWGPDYIKAAAARRGIKPEEVIPYYINLSALKVEIDWDDIAEAVAFLVGPGASKITGQTLVVDAGQVFVR